MNLNLLRTFVCVVEEGNFSRAANRLHLSQPAVSMQMQSLAQELGVELFLRVGHRVELTEGGAILYRQARELLQGWQQARQELDQLREQLRGRIDLGASTVPGDYLLPPLLCDFYRHQPGLELRMQVGASQGIVEALSQGRLDLAVVGFQPETADLASEKLFTDQLVAVIAPEHALARKKTLLPRDLLSQPMIMRGQGSATRRALETALGDAARKLRVIMELGSSRAVLEAAARGLGVAVVSRHAAADYIEAGRLQARTIAELELNRDFWLVLPRTQVNPAARELAKFLAGGVSK
ncbi:MAG: LysR family transcriptional regulator [Firmicutes bacterium]|nr:LysR family transcriptional regulator [Bacillota bacterium]